MGKRNYLKYLPKAFAKSLIDSQIYLYPQLPQELTIKLADTIEEKEGAFELIYRNSVEKSWLQSQEFESYYSRFHALPTTRVVVAKWNEEIIGTFSLVEDSPWGLPIEAVLDLDEYREKSFNLCELSFCSIHKDFIEKVTFPLFKFGYELIQMRNHLQKMFVAMDSSSIEPIYFEHFLNGEFFGKISTKGSQWQPYFVDEDIELNISICDLENLDKFLIKHFWGGPKPKDLYSFLKKEKFKNLTHSSFKPMSPSELNHFFNLRSDLFVEMPEEDKVLLHQYYNSFEYKDVLPKLEGKEVKLAPIDWQNPPPVEAAKPRRRLDREVRFQANAKVKIRFGEEFLCEGELIDLSLHGLSFLSEKNLEVGKSYDLEMIFSDHSVENIPAKIVWTKKSKGTYGLRIEDTETTEWPKVIHYLIDQESA